MRIVKKTLKGDLLGRTGFKKVAARKETPPLENIGDQPAEVVRRKPLESRMQDAAQRVLERLKDDDLVVITEPIQPKHGKAIVLDRDHREVGPPAVHNEPAGAPPREPGPAPAPPAAAAAPSPPAKASNRKASAPVRSPPAPPAAAAAAPAPATSPAAPASGPATVPGLRIDGDAVRLARSVIAEALFRDFGASGSKLQNPKGGSSFLVHGKRGEGVVHVPHTLMLPLPAGMATAHQADLVIELENGAVLVLDIVSSSVTSEQLKARSFDMFQLRRLDLAFSVLVFVRLPGSGMVQDQAEAIGHNYDVTFGVNEEQVHSEAAFAALRNRIAAWLAAASAK